MVLTVLFDVVEYLIVFENRIKKRARENLKNKNYVSIFFLFG